MVASTSSLSAVDATRQDHGREPPTRAGPRGHGGEPPAWVGRPAHGDRGATGAARQACGGELSFASSCEVADEGAGRGEDEGAGSFCVGCWRWKVLDDRLFPIRDSNEGMSFVFVGDSLKPAFIYLA